MAYESTKSCCIGDDCSVSSCCADEGENLNMVSNDANTCCTDVVKYFHQQTTTTIKENINIKSFQVWVSVLITQTPVSDETNLLVLFDQHSVTPARSGRSIIISVSSMLI